MKSLRPITTPLFRSSTTTTTIAQRSLQPRRNFLSTTNPFNNTTPQTITATRTLPYHPTTIYAVISDIARYQNFLPYCRSSTVTAHSQPAAADGKQYPEEAQLEIGFGENLAESFWSRVYCVPDRVVEAVSGDARTTLDAEDIAHHSPADPSTDRSRDTSVLTHLLTRWTLRPYPYKPPPTSAIDRDSVHKNHEETSPLPGQFRTEVQLRIEFCFKSPVYAALSAAAAEKVAEKMVGAFEGRVKKVVEGPGNVR